MKGSRPPFPAGLARRLSQLPDEAANVPPHALVQAGLELLERVLRRPGRHREVAFDLLAADALLTRACEAAADAADPAAELLDLLDRVGAHAP